MASVIFGIEAQSGCECTPAPNIDGTHVHYFAFDQLDAVVFPEDTGFAHSVIFIDRE